MPPKTRSQSNGVKIFAIKRQDGRDKSSAIKIRDDDETRKYAIARDKIKSDSVKVIKKRKQRSSTRSIKREDDAKGFRTPDAGGPDDDESDDDGPDDDDDREDRDRKSSPLPILLEARSVFHDAAISRQFEDPSVQSIVNPWRGCCRHSDCWNQYTLMRHVARLLNEGVLKCIDQSSPRGGTSEERMRKFHESMSLSTYFESLYESVWKHIMRFRALIGKDLLSKTDWNWVQHDWMSLRKEIQWLSNWRHWMLDDLRDVLDYIVAFTFCDR